MIIFNCSKNIKNKRRGVLENDKHQNPCRSIHTGSLIKKINIEIKIDRDIILVSEFDTG